jgi:hypothetical protein
MAMRSRRVERCSPVTASEQVGLLADETARQMLLGTAELE